MPRDPTPSPPIDIAPASSSTFTDDEEEETEESFTDPQCISEGQWLLSVASEGELKPAIQPNEAGKWIQLYEIV